MLKNYILIFFLCINSTFLFAQETITFDNYDGAFISVTATSTVNDEITILFEDIDIVNNFYTENQTEIYMYGGLNTSEGTFQGAPDFNTLSEQPALTLHNDTESAAGPNTYSITINLADYYSSVPDGTMVVGFNLLFQNQFGGGGNNQSADLYIDLADAIKSSTLNLSSVSPLDKVKTSTKNKEVYIAGINSDANISIYNILGQNILSNNFNGENRIVLDLSPESDGIYIVRITVEGQTKTTKIILD